MKKLYALLYLIVFTLPCFADYIPIPKEKSAEYKFEIEKAIKNKIPSSIETTNYVFDEIKKTYKDFNNKKQKIKFVNDKKTLCESNILYELSNMESSLELGELYIYKELINITAKYVYIDINYILATGFPTDIAIYLNPYFIDNNINLNNLQKYLNYVESKTNTYKQYMKNINNYCDFN